MGALAGLLLYLLQPVIGQRMRGEVVLGTGALHLAFKQNAQRIDKAARTLARSIEQAQGRSIGGAFFGLAIGHQRIDAGRLRGHDEGRRHLRDLAGIARARCGGYRTDPQQHGEGLNLGTGLHLFAQTGNVTASQVPDFMGQDALEGSRIGGFENGAVIDIDIAIFGDEGVEAPIVDDDDARCTLEPGSPEQRRSQHAHHGLDLGIADDTDLILGLHWQGCQGQGHNQAEGGKATVQGSGSLHGPHRSLWWARSEFKANCVMHKLDVFMIRDTIKPFYAMEIFARALALEAQGRQVCHLEVGEPGGAPAPRVIEAVKACLDRPMGYTAAKGTQALREKLAQYYRAQHGVDVDPARILVTMGSSSGFILTFMAGFKPGARIAVTRPGYPAYLNILASLNMDVAEIPVRAESGWKPTVGDIEAAHAQNPFDGLLLASPANPTGAVLDQDELAAVIACCDRLGVRFISDEIYHGLNYLGTDASALETSQNHIVVNSFSKYYCMTGWRIGWLVLPDDLVRQAEMMAQSLFISASSISQVAALAALDERAFYDARRQDYAESRVLLADGLARLGFGGATPADGAFYSYVDASAFSNDTMAFCIKVLEEAGVAATPGADFDRTDGHKFMRFSYAGTRETVQEALERLGRFLGVA